MDLKNKAKVLENYADRDYMSERFKIYKQAMFLLTPDEWSFMIRDEIKDREIDLISVSRWEVIDFNSSLKIEHYLNDKIKLSIDNYLISEDIFEGKLKVSL